MKELMNSSGETTAAGRYRRLNSTRVATRGAKQMGYSPNYLSDLLRKETGKTTHKHIQLVRPDPRRRRRSIRRGSLPYTRLR